LDIVKPTRNSWSAALLEVIVPASVALNVFFSWIMLVDSLRIPFYLYYERTIFLIYLDRSVDPIIWILSSIFVLCVLAAEARGRSVWLGLSLLLLSSGIAAGSLSMLGIVAVPAAGFLSTLLGCIFSGFAMVQAAPQNRRRRFAVVFLLVLSLLVLPVEVGSLLYYVLAAFWPGIEVGRSLESFELQLWYTGFALIPFLYVAFLFSWIWAPFLSRMLRKQMEVSPAKIRNMSVSPREYRGWLLGIAGCVLLAFLLGYYPYFHDQSYPLVGTDIYWRNVLPAQRVLSSGSWVDAAVKERHPVAVLLIAFASNFLGLKVESLLRFAYVGLILAFGGAIFLLVAVASGSKSLASLSALIATVTPTITDGMYTGIIANWLAVIVWYLSLAALGDRKRHGVSRFMFLIISLGIGSIAVLFLHPWTWIVMLVGLVVYSVIAVLLRHKEKAADAASILAVILLDGIAVTVSLLYISTAQGWRLIDAFSLIQGSLGSKYFGLASWEIVAFFCQIWSQFLHPVVLFLSILGVYALAQRHDRLSAIALAWLVAACITTMISAPMGYDPLSPTRGETQIFRAMFLTPFQITAAAGIMFVQTKLSSRLSFTDQSQSAAVAIRLLILVLFLAVLNGALRALFPLLTDPHNYPNPSAP
jgi:hypothetical protein